MAKNILICDDAAFMRMMIKDILTKNGYNVVGEAENGKIAVDKYTELSPDLVLLDIQLPQMNGLEAIQKIREVNENVPVFILTAFHNLRDVVNMLDVSIQEFIPKPFDIDELHNEIVFRAVPAFDFRDSIQNVFLKLLSDVKEEREIKDLRENIIISMSCKGAVKAGQKLSTDEMKNMVRRLHEVGEYTCPHGRPIIVKITRDDLDKMFGRKK